MVNTCLAEDQILDQKLHLAQRPYVDKVVQGDTKFYLVKSAIWTASISATIVLCLLCFRNNLLEDGYSYFTKCRTCVLNAEGKALVACCQFKMYGSKGLPLQFLQGLSYEIAITNLCENLQLCTSNLQETSFVLFSLSKGGLVLRPKRQRNRGIQLTGIS